MLTRDFHTTEVYGKGWQQFFVLILTELEDSLWARADVINIVLPKEGHRISALISVPLIQMFNF